MNRYRSMRKYENLQKVIFEGVGEYDIPALRPVRDCHIENWIGFNFAKGCEDPRLHGVHFFLDDYPFERIWQDPERYTDMLLKFGAGMTPDFSPYAAFPRAVQIYNHYRKHWMGAYWQRAGMLVIPTITWSDPSTLEWCFDGEPRESIVAMSSVGMFRTEEYKRWLLTGYEEMMRRLRPAKIIWRGMVPEEFDDTDRKRLVILPAFTEKWRETEEAESDGEG